MNEILQKRIEEAAENHEQFYNVGEEHGYLYTHKGDIKEAVIYGADFALHNQWISVEEALPDMIDEDMEWSDIVLIKCKYCEDMKPCIMTSRYDIGTGFWLNPVAREITHWMEIPSLKGGDQ